MGDLIVMSRAKPLRSREHSTSAEILFFTGVRYYRMADDAGEKPAALAGVDATGRSRHLVAAPSASTFTAAGAVEALV